jgi:PAS domain-containing protein
VTPVVGIPLSGQEEEGGATARWLRDAVEGAGVMLWQLDLAAGCGTIACSPAHAALIGADPAAVTPGALLCPPVPLAATPARIHPADLPGVRQALQAAAQEAEALPAASAEGPPFRLAFRLRVPAPDGGPRGMWVEATGRFQRDAASGRATRCAGVALDVTARREAEAARDREIAVRHAFRDASPDALWVADAATGRLENASRAFEAVLGVPPEAMMADHPYPWPELVYPEDRDRVAGGLEAARAGTSVELEYRVGDPAAGGRSAGCAAPASRSARRGPPRISAASCRTSPRGRCRNARSPRARPGSASRRKARRWGCTSATSPRAARSGRRRCSGSGASIRRDARPGCRMPTTWA